MNTLNVLQAFDRALIASLPMDDAAALAAKVLRERGEAATARHRGDAMNTLHVFQLMDDAAALRKAFRLPVTEEAR